MKITYAIASKPRFVLMREIEGETSRVVGEFETEAEALEFADGLKILDDQPGRDYGKRWLGLEAREI